jgi:hypothetical protein
MFHTPVLVIALIQLTGLDGQLIILSPNQIVTFRAPRKSEHFGPGVRCVINSTDGKFVAVLETCQQVRKQIELVQP